jgi:hypothetical protein
MINKAYMADLPIPKTKKKFSILKVLAVSFIFAVLAFIIWLLIFAHYLFNVGNSLG